MGPIGENLRGPKSRIPLKLACKTTLLDSFNFITIFYYRKMKCRVSMAVLHKHFFNLFLFRTAGEVEGAWRKRQAIRWGLGWGGAGFKGTVQLDFSSILRHIWKDLGLIMKRFWFYQRSPRV